MKIAVNTRLLLKDRLEGIGWFSHESLRRIVCQHPEHQFYFLFDRPFDESFVYNSNVTPVVAHPPARHPYLWYLFFEMGLPYQLRKIKPDLFLSTDGWIPLHLNPDIKVVDVIHDLNFEHHPEFIKPTVLRYYRRFFHRFAQTADRIATVSEYTRQDIHQLYHVPLENIDVVYNGCNELFHPLSEDEKTQVREAYAHGCDFFLFVGLIHKRKNLDTIFRAFDLFKERTDNNMKLLVVGDKKWWQGDIEDSYNAMRHREDVIMLGRQSMPVLTQLTGAARALVYASLFEGFGIPILEAFHAETAVLTSNVTSMPEVAGDAALLVDPHREEDIAEAMHTLWQDNELRNQLIDKGRTRRECFSWQQTADKLWQTIETLSTVRS
ncbi:MAG: glycosyltransferase family 4 protein [Bacteroidales bacterium]|nr:glycosyltransferase family 4 protein [Bacteroidales bacterium]